MKKIIFGCLGLMLALQVVVPAMATPSFVTAERGTVSIKTPLSDDVYAAGESVTIDKPIQGDLIVAGGDVELNANVSGDVWVAGGTVTIRGNVGDDIRMTGGELSLYGTVGDDVLAAGGQLTIGKEGTIKGDLLAASGELSMDGKVLGSLKLSAGTISIGGIVNGSAELRVGDALSFSEGARVGGTLKYWAAQENSELTKHAAKVEYHKFIAKDWNTKDLFKGVLGISFAVLLWKWLAMMILGGLLIAVLPKYLAKTYQHVKTKYWEATWHGLLVLIVVPVVAFLAMLTIIGAPIAVVLMLAYGLLMIFGTVTGAYFVGQMILRKESSPMYQLAALAIGIIIFLVIGVIPVIGGLVRLWIILIGLGGVYQEKIKLAENYK
jgi:cytoskeletal protein CcmA (bactofilin family)